MSARVKDPKEQDCKNLVRVLEYLKVTPEECLTLSIEYTKLIKWWVGGLYIFHRYMRIHTGVMMPIGKRSLYYMPHKQKMNTKSSTDTVLVSADDVMSHLLWKRYFLEAPWCRVGASRLYQNNMSSVMLDKNGKLSIGKRMRHINIQYLFIKARAGAGGVIIKHCPTDKIWGDSS